MLTHNMLRSLSCFNPILRRVNRNAVAVLMYHGVVKDTWNSTDGDWLQVTESAFLEQMRHLKRHYNVIPLSDIMLPNTSNKPRAVITFDDGYQNNYTVAYNILKMYDLPATIFTVTGQIDTTSLFWFDKLHLCGKHQLIPELKKLHPNEIEIKAEQILTSEPRIKEDHKQPYLPLTTKQIREMSQSGIITFGSHTHRHEIATTLPMQEFISTLSTSSQVLTDIIGSKPKMFCFPNGWYSLEHLDVLREFGFAISTKVGGGFYTPSADLLQIPRISIGRTCTMPYFRAAVASTLYRLTMLKQSMTVRNRSQVDRRYKYV